MEEEEYTVVACHNLPFVGHGLDEGMVILTMSCISICYIYLRIHNVSGGIIHKIFFLILISVSY
jgi:hypothetical protein